MENKLFYHMMSQYHSFYHSVCWLSGVFQVSCHCYTRGEVFINHLFQPWDVKRLAVNFEHIFTIIIPLNISCLVDNDGYEPLLAWSLQRGQGPVLRLKHPSYLVTTLGTHTHLHTSHYPVITGHHSVLTLQLYPGYQVCSLVQSPTPLHPLGAGSDQGLVITMWIRSSDDKPVPTLTLTPD